MFPQTVAIPTTITLCAVELSPGSHSYVQYEIHRSRVPFVKLGNELANIVIADSDGLAVRYDSNGSLLGRASRE